jgi:hypothetical protein
MRPIALIAAAAASLMATSAFAAAPIGPVSRIDISIGSWLDQKRVDKVNDRDLAYLKDELRKSVEAQLSRTGKLAAEGGGRLELVIEDAVNNRPTVQELTYYPALSYKSFANGGAEITGVYVAPDGSRTPIGYVRQEADIHEARYAYTWRDANRAFDSFALALTSGEADDQLKPRTEKYYPGREGLFSGR